MKLSITFNRYPAAGKSIYYSGGDVKPQYVVKGKDGKTRRLPRFLWELL